MDRRHFNFYYPIRHAWQPEPFAWNPDCARFKHLFDYIGLGLVAGERAVLWSDILAHPAFMEPEPMIAFLDRLASFLNTINPRRGWFETARDACWARTPYQLNWSLPLGEEVRNLIARQNPGLVHTSIVDLLTAQRNRRQHFDEDTQAERDILGYPPRRHFAFWDDRYPYFFMYMYLRVAIFTTDPNLNRDRLFEDENFRPYFPASADFYTRAASMPFWPGNISPDWRRPALGAAAGL